MKKTRTLYVVIEGIEEHPDCGTEWNHRRVEVPKTQSVEEALRDVVFKKQHGDLNPEDWAPGEKDNILADILADIKFNTGICDQTYSACYAGEDYQIAASFLSFPDAAWHWWLKREESD